MDQPDMRIQDLAVLFDSILCERLQGCTASLSTLQYRHPCAQTHVACSETKKIWKTKRKSSSVRNGSIIWTLVGERGRLQWFWGFWGFQSLKIISDPSHILHKELMPSGRRYGVPICQVNRYRFSLIPLSVKLLNNKWSKLLCGWG